MPYIPQNRRLELDHAYTPLPETPGELNYTLTCAILDYLDNKDGVGYAAYNEVIGVLESCKLEFYRRQVAPYEDAACKRNGDVFTVPE